MSQYNDDLYCMHTVKAKSAEIIQPTCIVIVIITSRLNVPLAVRYSCTRWKCKRVQVIVLY